MSPVRTSNVQSPPRAAAPVRLSDAATIAPVRIARSWTKAAPSGPAPTSHPYSIMSAPGAKLAPILASSGDSAAADAASSRRLPRLTAASLPWENRCSAEIPERPCNTSAICASPSCAASRTWTSVPGASPASSTFRSGTSLSTNTTALLACAAVCRLSVAGSGADAMVVAEPGSPALMVSTGSLDTRPGRSDAPNILRLSSMLSMVIAGFSGRLDFFIFPSFFRMLACRMSPNKLPRLVSRDEGCKCWPMRYAPVLDPLGGS